MNVWCLEEGGGFAKPWLLVILDDYSGAIVGYILRFGAPSASDIALALRRAIWHKRDPRWSVRGVPAVLRGNCGSAFASAQLEEAARFLEIELESSVPKNPRGSGKTERFFHAINGSVLSVPSGHVSTGDRPTDPGPTLTTLDACVGRWLFDWCNIREHGGSVMSPLSCWDENEFSPRMPGCLQDLDMLLVTAASERRVTGYGIYFRGIRYADPALASYGGEYVSVRYDPYDPTEISSYHEGFFLMRAACSSPMV